MNTKLELNVKEFSPSEIKIISAAHKCGAPIEVVKNKKSSSRRHSALGSTFSPYKNFVDLRNNRKISIGQARQIIAKYEL